MLDFRNFACFPHSIQGDFPPTVPTALEKDFIIFLTFLYLRFAIMDSIHEQKAHSIPHQFRRLFRHFGDHARLVAPSHQEARIPSERREAFGAIEERASLSAGALHHPSVGQRSSIRSRMNAASSMALSTKNCFPCWVCFRSCR